MWNLQKMLEETLLSAAALKNVSEDKLVERLRRLYEKMPDDIANRILKTLHKNAPKMLKHRLRIRDAFNRRHVRRWGKPLKLLEMLHVACEEIGSEYNTLYQPDAARDQDFRFEAIVSVHAKAVLVSGEILCLLRNGYADGALSRWRTLHELAVTAHFLSEHDKETAERYMLSFQTQACRAMRQYQNYQTRANLDPFPAAEIRAMEKANDAIVARLGKEMKSDYGWAAKALKKEKPNFLDIEIATGLDHWRPRYKWASQHTHANHRPRPNLLGMAGADKDIFLVGPSNGGLTDPAHMTAISLVTATNALLRMRPDLDYLVTISILRKLEAQIGDAFWKSDRRLMEWHEKKLNAMSDRGRKPGEGRPKR